MKNAAQQNAIAQNQNSNNIEALFPPTPERPARYC
jgi:hypothetical protein